MRRVARKKYIQIKPLPAPTGGARVIAAGVARHRQVVFHGVSFFVARRHCV
jgi:hypothetical protein